MPWEGGGNTRPTHQIPDAVGASSWARGRKYCSWGTLRPVTEEEAQGWGQALVPWSQVPWRDRNFQGLALPSLSGQWQEKKQKQQELVQDGEYPEQAGHGSVTAQVPVQQEGHSQTGARTQGGK